MKKRIPKKAFYNKSLRISIIAYFIIITGIFTFLVPPFQKPDEYTHFIKSLAVSQGKYFCDSNRTTITANSDYIQFIKNKEFNRIIAHKNRKLNTTSYIHNIRLFNRNDTLATLDISKLCKLSPVPYFFSSAGLSIARIFNLSVIIAFFLGRFTQVIMLYIWMYYLYKFIPHSMRGILLFSIALPQTLHQFTAYSYDGFIISMFFTSFVLTIFYLLNKKNSFLFLFTSILAVVLGLLSRSSIAIVYPERVNPLIQYSLIQNDALEYIFILIYTTFIKNIFYLQSLIGIFGWLEYGMNHSIYFLFILLSLYIIILSSNQKIKSIKKYQICILIALIIFYYVVILSINFLYWTPVGNKIIEGVQGRYFLPILPFILLLCTFLYSRFIPIVKIKLDKNMVIISIIIGEIIVILSILHSVITRFYS